MKARIRQFLHDLSESFWLLPGAMVMAGILLALALVRLDRSPLVARWLEDGSWLYDGGGTGARTLLGAVASSTIGVAGTVFSITIASLSLAAGQMGPRLLRNFTRDRGNQFALGIYLATFSFALMVLRSIRTQDEGGFVPHLSMTVAMLLALVCVLTLVYFVHHMASRINVDTVIDLVSDDLRAAMTRLTTERDQPAAPMQDWRGATAIADDRDGYLQQIDAEALADWAAKHGTCVRLLVRPGDHMFPGTPMALLTRPVPDAAKAIREATLVGPHRSSVADLEYAVRQLVEVAVRALSPGINDPYTAIGVLDRLGTALCGLAGMAMPTNVACRDGVAVLVAPSFDYDGLTDSMFHMIRQNAAGDVAVLIRMLEVLTAVASCERDEARGVILQRHARLVLQQAEQSIELAGDLADVRNRYADFGMMRRVGVQGMLAATNWRQPAAGRIDAGTAAPEAAPGA